ncbi:MAG: transposase [Candidatus Competibacteraceae bacterium]|nr:transposase [Candidatus Competibacteraceae bacterium]
MEKTVILGMMTNRKKETVKRIFMSIPKRLRKQVGFICSDMHVGFINTRRKFLGKRFRS